MTDQISHSIDACYMKPIAVLHSICLGVEPSEGENFSGQCRVCDLFCCLSIAVVAFICTYSSIVRGEPILVAHLLGGKEMRRMSIYRNEIFPVQFVPVCGFAC